MVGYILNIGQCQSWALYWQVGQLVLVIANVTQSLTFNFFQFTRIRITQLFYCQIQIILPLLPITHVVVFFLWIELYIQIKLKVIRVCHCLYFKLFSSWAGCWSFTLSPTRPGLQRTSSLCVTRLQGSSWQSQALTTRRTGVSLCWRWPGQTKKVQPQHGESNTTVLPH